ncbi:MAG: glutamate--tRNA ligase [Candidatus Colwellbacteria bacterium RIFCSPLOWO2_01_FULL_48_10]|uniref:Glutamate--tRNA ligase n=1 Tax=Candidatus Colwellbacteria bacterium RIFCSPLOWO2_01_FULL_48_10 TaxID=1797690 RepID=A0A1G1Z4S7_9BACT|nr:MAG: glutamate--tRNA ligase [Candidatus Colwellbacteria bacterium RIFCSPLOWO2_01_FULL_48_10]
MIRTRFAPSPTGKLHVGGARTAFFSWLFARQNEGKFILRIEDTDKERSKPEFEKGLIESLKWLGFDWDEFYRQSERTEIYKDLLKKLIKEGRAYHCFCPKEDLDAERESLAAAGLPQIYSGRCRSIAQNEAEERVKKGDGYVIRLKVPEKIISFTDIIRETVKFDSALIGDFIIARDIENPLFHFVVVVDDSLMEITHVIRGEEHLPNTPRHILIVEALGFKSPEFAHLPLLLNADRSKMSKRFNDVAVDSYKENGYLPEAIINFIAFLGWHPVDNKEVMTKEELIKEFSLERVQKGGAVFNIEKLEWMNAKYISQLSDADFMKIAAEFLPVDWRLTPAIISSVKDRVKKMSDLKDLVSLYFELPDYPAELLKWKGMELSAVATNLSEAASFLELLPPEKFNKGDLESTLVEETKNKPKGEVFWPLRTALSGRDKSPTPFEIMAALGKDESLRRIRIAIQKTTA